MLWPGAFIYPLSPLQDTPVPLPAEHVAKWRPTLLLTPRVTQSLRCRVQSNPEALTCSHQISREPLVQPPPVLPGFHSQRKSRDVS
ncbi:hypothetical protein FKM82_014976 [Ascaphus truei]